MLFKPYWVDKTSEEGVKMHIPRSYPERCCCRRSRMESESWQISGAHMILTQIDPRDTLRNPVCALLTSQGYCNSWAHRTSEHIWGPFKEIRRPINTRLLYSPVLCSRHWRERKTSSLCVKGSPETPLCTQLSTKGFSMQLYFVLGSNPPAAKLVWLWTGCHKMKASFLAVMEDVLMQESRGLATLGRRLGEKWTLKQQAPRAPWREGTRLSAQHWGQTFRSLCKHYVIKHFQAKEEKTLHGYFTPALTSVTLRGFIHKYLWSTHYVPGTGRVNKMPSHLPHCHRCPFLPPPHLLDLFPVSPGISMSGCQLQAKANVESAGKISRSIKRPVGQQWAQGRIPRVTGSCSETRRRYRD